MKDILNHKYSGWIVFIGNAQSLLCDRMGSVGGSLVLYWKVARTPLTRHSRRRDSCWCWCWLIKSAQKPCVWGSGVWVKHHFFPNTTFSGQTRRVSLLMTNFLLSNPKSPQKDASITTWIVDMTFCHFIIILKLCYPATDVDVD